jgi:hypothetical protein
MSEVCTHGKFVLVTCALVHADFLYSCMSSSHVYVSTALLMQAESERAIEHGQDLASQLETAQKHIHDTRAATSRKACNELLASRLLVARPVLSLFAHHTGVIHASNVHCCQPNIHNCLHVGI